MVSEPISYGWRGPITDDEMIDLVRSHGGNAVACWWDQVKRHSLGWVDARDRSFEASTSRPAASAPPTRA